MSVASPATRARRRAAHYLLRLHVGPLPYTGSVPDAPSYRGGELALPIPPQSVKLEARARTHLAPHGLEQIADEHGVAPPDITITGTMGQAAFGADPTRDGRAWQRELEAVIRFYLHENYRRGTNREPLLALSWHDTYRGEHWYVTPQAIPYGEQDASNPYRERYTLRLAALKPYGGAATAIDALARSIEPDRHANVLATRNPNAQVLTPGTTTVSLASGATTDFEQVAIDQGDVSHARLVPTAVRGTNPDRYDLVADYLEGSA